MLSSQFFTSARKIPVVGLERGVLPVQLPAGRASNRLSTGKTLGFR
jgi:hypothetical protein